LRARSVDYHSIAGQSLFDDTYRQRRTLYPLLFTAFTGPLLAFDHPHEVFGRLDIQLLTLLIPNDDRLSAAVAADTLFGRTCDNLLFSRQFLWQLLPARMFASRPEW
jgi:hypothetical protein